MKRLAIAFAVAVGCAAYVGASKEAPYNSQDAASLSKQDPPANGVWLDTLDLSKVAIRRGRG